MSVFSWYLLTLFLSFAIFNINEFVLMVRIHHSKVIAPKEKDVTISRHLRYSALSTLIFFAVSILSFFIRSRMHS